MGMCPDVRGRCVPTRARTQGLMHATLTRPQRFRESRAVVVAGDLDNRLSVSDCARSPLGRGGMHTVHIMQYPQSGVEFAYFA